MSTPATRLCSQCHARVALEPAASTCPACGGKLIGDPASGSAPAPTPPPQIDHRGIVLPPRHAVGGIITPR